ncbi:hypothetical protein V6Z11_D10G123400 [Gossypium hirsutum]
MLNRHKKLIRCVTQTRNNSEQKKAEKHTVNVTQSCGGRVGYTGMWATWAWVRPCRAHGHVQSNGQIR